MSARTSKKRQVKHVTFQIYGEDFTRLARDLWREGSYGKAIRLLVYGLNGPSGARMTEPLAIEICTGRKKLVGDVHGMDLEDDDAHSQCPSVADMLDRMQSNIDERQEIIEDMRQMQCGNTVIIASPTGPRRVPRRRVTLDTGSHFRASKWILKGQWSDLPVWEDVNDNQFAQYGEERPIGAREVGEGHEARLDEGWRRSEAKLDKDLPMPEGLEHLAPPTMREVFERLVSESPIEVPEPVTEITSPHGWLNREGKFYPCAYMEHRGLADALAGLIGVDLQDQPDGGGEGILESKGWVKLHGQGFARGPLATLGAKPPTKAQERLILQWCELTGGKYPTEVM
jgi:hypothetical protein